MPSPFNTASATDYRLATKADADLPGGPARGLLVGIAGSANLMTLDGHVREGVPLQAGFNPLIVKQVRTGGTASNIFAIY